MKAFFKAPSKSLGSRNGVGYTISQYISPLAIVFMIAQKITHMVIRAEESGTTIDKQMIFDTMKHKFDDLTAFKKYFPTMETLKFN